MTHPTSPPSGHIAAQFSSWIGRSNTVDDEITLPAVRRMAAMLDMDPQSFEHGTVLAPHWYSMFFTPNAQRSQIGHDGHPRKGDFLPPIPLPRRMFVGRKVHFPGQLRVGDKARKRSEIVAIEQKEGRSGTLVFLTVQHTIEVAERAVVIERQEVVYRDAAGSISSSASPTPLPHNGAWTAEYMMDPVLVFRYSALTWNGHRIHYDADYARNEEGYPGCVMNGALTLHLLIEEALKQASGRRLSNLSAKLVKPLFVGEPLTVAGTALDNCAMQGWATNAQGALAATCALQFEEA